jgi:hypothetical protein
MSMTNASMNAQTRTRTLPNVSKLRDAVDDVSDPDSPNYDPTDPNFDSDWEANSKKREGRSAADQPVDGFDPNVVDVSKATPSTTVKPADGASWNHCDVKNDYGNRQDG